MIPVIGYNSYGRMISEVYNEEYTLRAPEVPGATSSLKQLKGRGNELFLISAGVPKRIQYSKRWLQKNGIYRLFSGFESTISAEGIETKSKEDVCRELGLDALIDDDLRHLEDIRLEHLKRILLKHDGPEEFDLMDIKYARNWQEAISLLR